MEPKENNNDNGNDGDLNNYEEEIFAGMRARQDAPCYYIDANYFELQKEASVTPRFRFILVEWMMEVSIDMHISRDALWLAVFIVDRFLTVSPLAKLSDLQLLGAVALCIGEKYEDATTYLVKISDYLKMCSDDAKGDMYSRKQGLAMECLILKELDGRLCPPTSLFFLRGYTRHTPSNISPTGNNLEYLLTRYYAEAALLCAPMLSYTPNAIAAGCFYLARRACKITPWWPIELATFGNIEVHEAETVGIALHKCCVEMRLEQNQILHKRHPTLWSKLQAQKTIPTNDSITTTTDTLKSTIFVQ